MLVAGVLFQDDDPSRDLQERVALCAAMYFKKRRILPVVAYVNPAELNGEKMVGTVELVGHGTVLPTHYILS